MISFIYAVFIYALQAVTDNQGPPPPANNGDPEGPQLPIDDNIWILIILGLLFGVYVIFKRNQAINKAA